MVAAVTPEAFRSRLRNRDPLVGTFVKTPSATVCEVLGLTALDAVCLDAEHAPFERSVLDHCLLALRAAGKPALVRVPSAAPEAILNALDCGATGVVVPHVTGPDAAARVARATRFGPEGRGYAGSTRAAGYGTKPMGRHLADSAERTTVIAQVEDVAGVDAVAEVAAVEGIDCLFIGQMDLCVAYGADSPDEPIVTDAVLRVCAAAADAGRATGMFVRSVEEVARWRNCGVSLFLLASDHAFILRGAAALVEAFEDAAGR